MRDVKSIVVKLKYISIPVSSAAIHKNVLKDWDLWGPLILCTFMALNLHHNETDQSFGPHFAEIFVLLWFGSYIVSLNYKLLSASSKRKSLEKNLYMPPSIFQLLCVFGYCLAPPAIGIIVLKLVSSFFAFQLKYLFYEKLLIGILLGFIWPTASAVKILARFQEKEKRFLAIYPVALFYFVLSWMIITTH